MKRGLIDADLGGNVIKKRVGVPGHGKRGGARMIVATAFAERWIFLYGFRKNERSNLRRDELRALQEVASELLGLNDRQLEVALQAGELEEVGYDNSKA
jgi:hypothetical protein